MTQVKHYVISTSSTDDSESPGAARFSATREFAQIVLDLCKLVNTHNLYKVEKFYALPEFSNNYYVDDVDTEEEIQEIIEADDFVDEELRVESITLNVSEDTFWFAANIKHAANEFTTDECSIQELAEFFGLSV